MRRWRGNGGGNVSPCSSNGCGGRGRDGRQSPANAERTHQTARSSGRACLLKEYSASDGDIFSYGFRHHKLGR